MEMKNYSEMSKRELQQEYIILGLSLSRAVKAKNREAIKEISDEKSKLIEEYKTRVHSGISATVTKH